MKGKKLGGLLLAFLAVFFISAFGVNAEDTHVAEINGKPYDSISAAINEANQEKTTTTITMTGDFTNNAENPTVISNIILDLNGHKLKTGLLVTGNLTIKSSKNGGELIAKSDSKTSPIIVQGDKAKLTLESGKISSKYDETDGTAIYCRDGGTAIVNGGEILSTYQSLGGNNTTGNAKFEVNGGTLTAEKGPAIYMPTQGSLKVTSGTLNGGISLRMGNVEISGGTINATTGSIDSLSEYYNYSGNAWFADALYVWGGSYASTKTNNDLSLNITGGTFNTKNEQGSAVAIYDLGKVAQNISVTISKNAKLNTNSKTRNAFDVLTLPEAGVTSYQQGYNNPEYTGKIKTTLIGGTYNKKPESVAKGYESYKVLGQEKYIVAKPSDVKEVTETKQVAADAISESSKKTLDEKLDGKKVAGYYDVTVYQELNGEKVGTVSETAKKISFKLAIPEALAKPEKGYTRKYTVYIVHTSEDGKETVEAVDTTDNGDGTLTVESNKFSTYVITYNDTKTKENTSNQDTAANEDSKSNDKVSNPQTGDKILYFVLAAIVSLTGVLAGVVTLKKRFN